MTAFELRLRLPEEIPEEKAGSTFYWTTQTGGTFISNLGRLRLGPSLGVLGPVPEANIEFVRLAAAVYAADCSVKRQGGGSNWSQRDFELLVPVYSPQRWEPIRDRLQQLLAFLSGDSWSLKFVETEAPEEKVQEIHQVSKRAVLLSGGADSAVGALISRQELGKEPQTLVSHFGGARTVSTIQRGIAEMIAQTIPGSEQVHKQINFSRRSKQPNGHEFVKESSTRTRSLLFLALGFAVASIHNVELWIPENGFASLNPPLGQDRRGSLSTRTTHPAYIEGLTTLLGEAGVYANLVNPFSRVTKGEMFRRAADVIGNDEASKLLSGTFSCAHTDLRFLGVSHSYQCGVCFGCVVRRSAFAAAGLEDRSQYLSELSSKKVKAYSANKSVERSVQIFVNKGLSVTDIATLNLPVSYSGSDALDLCNRAIEEMRQLFS